MGRWGHGNFDNDTSSDHLSILTGQLIKEITYAMAEPRELEPDEYWGCAVPCNIELLTPIARQHWVGATLPKPAIIEQWRATYMAVRDETIDQLELAEPEKIKRRTVLTRTFDDLLEQAERG